MGEPSNEYKRGIVAGLTVASDVTAKMLAKDDTPEEAKLPLRCLQNGFSTAALLASLDVQEDTGAGSS